ncbi:MAG: tetraacyldisaccharide 4'-kinase [Bacteroides sp.]|nr:tetraacyldisaccharide 4'-kinase [Bacteroides sp.]
MSPSKAVNNILTAVLTPLSWGYGAVTWIRNKMFDAGVILREQEFDIPVVCVGNITVGGTGKTPHVEYILRNLSGRYRIAVLSRGYKRKTKGFVLANRNSSPADIGDEPLQIYRKFGGRVIVAVCESRRKGIKALQENFPNLDVIVLDDAFQHRYVKPKVSILLTDFNRPFYNDRMLPLGRLRESTFQVNRADMVVVTKCPRDISPIDIRIIRKKLNLMKFQSLFFSTFEHTDILPVFPDEARYQVSLDSLSGADSVLLVTGVANPRGFIRYFKHFPFKVKVDHYPDHHDFTRGDISEITERFEKLQGARKIIVTTEKDAVRLQHNPYFPHKLKPYIFYLPVEVKMLESPSGDFVEALSAAIEGRSRMASYIDAEQAEATSAYERIVSEENEQESYNDSLGEDHTKNSFDSRSDNEAESGETRDDERTSGDGWFSENDSRRENVNNNDEEDDF